MAIALETIQSEFENQLLLPNIQSNTQFLICPVGYVGAGKTTVVSPVAKTLNILKVSSNELKKLLQESGNGFERAREILFPILTRQIHAGRSIVLDMDCGNPHTAAWIRHAERVYDIKVFWLHVNPPENFIVEKLKNFKHTWLFKNGQEAVQKYFEQKAHRKQEKQLMKFFYTFDPSRADLQLQIATCVQQIQSEVK